MKEFDAEKCYSTKHKEALNGLGKMAKIADNVVFRE